MRNARRVLVSNWSWKKRRRRHRLFKKLSRSRSRVRERRRYTIANINKGVSSSFAICSTSSDSLVAAPCRCDATAAVPCAAAAGFLRSVLNVTQANKHADGYSYERSPATGTHGGSPTEARVRPCFTSVTQQERWRKQEAPPMRHRSLCRLVPIVVISGYRNGVIISFMMVSSHVTDGPLC